MQAPDDGDGGGGGGAGPDQAQGDRDQPGERGGRRRPPGAVAHGGVAPAPQESWSSEVAEGSVQAAEGRTSGGVPVVEGHALQAQPADVAEDESHVMEFALSLPCLDYLDSQLALQYFTMGAQTFHGPVHMDFDIFGTELLVRLYCSDAELLQVSAAALLNQLTYVVRTLQQLLPPSRSRPPPGRGA